MNEDDLRKLLTPSVYEEVKRIVQEGKKTRKSPDEIKTLVKRYLMEGAPDTSDNLIGNLQMHVPPGR